MFFFLNISTLSFSVDFSGFNQGYGSEGGVDPDPNPTHEKQHGSDLKKISRYLFSFRYKSQRNLYILIIFLSINVERNFWIFRFDSDSDPTFLQTFIRT